MIVSQLSTTYKCQIISLSHLEAFVVNYATISKTFTGLMLIRMRNGGHKSISFARV